jgi:O-antigen/teichoic acid export membrane protein
MSNDEIGRYNYLFAFVQMISMNLNFGLYIAQSKLYHDYEQEQRRSLLFTINLILVSLLGLFLLPVYLFGLDYNLADLLFEKNFIYADFRYPILLAIVVSSLSYMVFNFLLTSESISHVQFYNLLRLFVSNGVVIIILVFSESDKVLIRLLFYYVCELLLMSYFAIGYIKNFKVSFQLDLFKKIIHLSIPAFLLTLIATIQGFSDKFYIQQKTDMSVLAIYTIGATIAAVCGLIIQSFQNIWLPIFFKEKDIVVNFRKTRKMTQLIIVLFSIISIVLIAGTKFALILNIIPKNYNDVLPILPFLLLSQIILSVNAMYGNYFSYFNKVYMGAILGGIVYIACFFLNFFLIPRYGVSGAIISLLAGNTLLVSVVYFSVRKLYLKALASH